MAEITDNFKYSGGGVETLAGKDGHFLDIYFLSTGINVKFLSFITDFKDNYTSNWTTTEIYGRMDPVATFKNTTRKISLAFDVPSYNINDSQQNAQKADQVIQGLYPVYNDVAMEGVSILSAPPLVRIKYANLICVANDEDKGLLGYLGGFSFSPSVDKGFFMNEKKLIPKHYSVSFEFFVLHEHALGNKQDTIATKTRIPRINVYSFPHKYDNLKTVEDTRKVDTSNTGTGDTETGKTDAEAATSGQTEDVLLNGGNQ
jgi:hypothetical protein